MSGSDFKKKEMKKEVAKSDLNIKASLGGKNRNDTLGKLINYQLKINITQYISAGIMLISGIVISLANENGIGITIGSFVQGDTTVSNITVNLGALLILGGLYVFLNVVKNSNTNFKEK